MDDISKDNLPRHIAVIMDGNGRWARRRFLNRINGHQKGVLAARNTVKWCSELGIDCLTLYTFSKENWMRPAAEVAFLMAFLERHLREEEKTLVEGNIRFRAIGVVGDLPASVQRVVRNLEERTAGLTGMTLQLALSYGGRQEITAAAKEIARRVAAGMITPNDVTEELIQGLLYTAGMPDPDLLIRTSGEKRISNFLLWQMAYTEIYITDELWPDFTREHLMAAIKDYAKRERRFGLVKEEGAVALN